MGSPQLYCPICGAPITDKSGDGSLWLSNAALLTTAHETENGSELDEYWPRSVQPPVEYEYAYHLGPNPPEETHRSVVRLEVEGTGTSRFELPNSGEIVHTMWAEYVRGNKQRQAHGGPLYLPFHGVCLDLTHHFIESAATFNQTGEGLPNDRITSLKQLWEIYYRRVNGAWTAVPDAYGTLPEPHDYFGGYRCRNTYWAPEDDPAYGELLEQNPIQIPNLTESILENLELRLYDVLEGATSNESDDEYPDAQNLELKCDYAHSSDWWCDVLASKQIFPWLWDLDVKMVREKQADGRWDWELLVRKISQLAIHEPDDTTLKLPLALRNRRRVWRLLEEARLDDIAGPERKMLEKREEERRRFVSEQPVPDFPGPPPGFPMISGKSPFAPPEKSAT